MYPRTLVAAFNLLENWKQDPRNMVRMGGGPNDGVVFTNIAEDDAAEGNEATKRDLSHITCFNCKKKGHYASKCPQQVESGLNLMTIGAAAQDCGSVLAQHGDYRSVEAKTSRGNVPKTWLLLDNQSTVDLFCNSDLLSSARHPGH